MEPQTIANKATKITATLPITIEVFINYRGGTAAVIFVVSASAPKRYNYIVV